MARKTGKATARKGRTGSRTLVLVATRKGAWLYHGDAARKIWRADGPHFLGHNMSHLVLDPRDGKTLLAAAKTGHLGPTIFRSTDFGKSWKEAARPPAFAKAADGKEGRSVDHTFWLAPGRAQDRDVWYAGTSPQGLFRSTDGGITWEPYSIINDDPQFREWMGTVQDGTPDGPKLHSIIVDPRDGRHLYIAMSGGGVHESTDSGRTWKTLIKGLDVVEGFGFDPAKPTFHDPHCVRLCPANPDRLTSRITAASTASIAPPIRGCASARACQKRSATSVSRWSCTRATRTPRGCSRWMARRSGRARAPAASLLPTSRATAARPGIGSTPACPGARRGGR